MTLMALRRLLTISNGARIAVFCVGLMVSVALGRWLHTVTQPLTADNAGRLLLTRGRAEDAMYLFEKKDWLGVALYRAGRYNRAIATFADENTVESIYNMGTAYAQIGRFEPSIEIFQRVLEEDPEHDDARYNLALVKQAQTLVQEQQPGDSRSPGPPENDSADKTDPGDDSRGANDDIIQTVKSEPTPADDSDAGKQLADNNQQTGSVQTQPGDGAGDTDLESVPEDGSSLAASLPKNDDSADDVPDDAPLMSGELQERLAEDAHAEDILLRHIQDDAKVVLRARLRMALKRQLSEIASQ